MRSAEGNLVPMMPTLFRSRPRPHVGRGPNGFEIRKGASDAVANYLSQNGRPMPSEVKTVVEDIARSGGTPLVVAEKSRGALE